MVTAACPASYLLWSSWLFMWLPRCTTTTTPGGPMLSSWPPAPHRYSTYLAYSVEYCFIPAFCCCQSIIKVIIYLFSGWSNMYENVSACEKALESLISHVTYLKYFINPTFNHQLQKLLVDSFRI